MKSSLCLLVLTLVLVLAACSAAKPDPEADKAAKPAEKATGRDTFKRADEFDSSDVAAIRKERNEWVSAFAKGNAAPVEFMFTNDAVFSLPEHPSPNAGDSGLSPKQLFDHFTAELVFDETSEQFVTDGGDPRKMTKLPWVSYYSAYKLTLIPKHGGDPLETAGRFMTRFHRQSDGSLKVIRGPSVGQRAPDFNLNLMKSDGQVQLSALRGKPTILIFGSYT